MYLKSLEIHGFKSFSEKTVLAFLPPKGAIQSITAIVGPNGSGKSNVADAIRWILGEQSMKLMRAKKSVDLIFCGSDAKGKMGAASAALVIDNRDGKLPIDYEELVITRRVYSNGDGEYLINGHNVRLFDLHLLLAKAQFGQGSYSVIGQGMIDRLLVQTPAERKDFFDEAFGIKEFKIKRHQAVLKLSRTKDNLAQAEALLAEISPRLKSLSRQVKKLEQRQKVEVELREAQEIYYITLWKRNESKLDKLKNDLESIELKYADSEKKLSSMRDELAKLAKESSRQEIYNNLIASYQDIVRRKNRLEQDNAALRGRMQVEYSKAGKHNIGWLEDKISSLRDNQKKLSDEICFAHEMVSKLTKDIAEKKHELDTMAISRTELKSRLSSIENGMARARNDQNFFYLAGLKAVRAVLEKRDQFGGRVYGTVAQLAEVDEKYQLAMDVAAGSHLSSIVVENDEVAKSGIRYLRDEQLGVAAFLPLNKIKPRFVSQDIRNFLKKTGVHGLASDLAKFNARFENVFSYVFGNTLIIENLDAAREIGIGRVRMVTLEGDVLETSGSMKGGYRKKRASSLSFFCARSARLMRDEMMDYAEKAEQLKRELDDLEAPYERARESLRELRTALEIENEKQQFLDRQKKDVDSELAALEQEMSFSTMGEKDYSSAMKSLEVLKKKTDEEIVRLEQELADAQKKIEQFNQEEEEKKKRVFALQDLMQAAQAALNNISNDRNEKQISIARLETRQEDLSNEVYQELRSSVESIVKRGAAPVEEADLESLQITVQKLKYKLSLIGGIDDEVKAEYEETRARYESLSVQLEDLNKALKDLEKLVVELDNIMKKKRGRAFKEIKKEFSRYFKLLFDGGRADLVEVYDYDSGDDNRLEAGVSGRDGLEDASAEGGADIEAKRKRGKKILIGIEIVACPPGKKIKNLAALSGGERTLTSIALICAVLRTNPPPFVVLDEVEAALDETNTLRFTKILKELAKQSQFILITHNRATMHSADALYGVTMGNDGVSRVLSVKFGEADGVRERGA